MTTILRGTVTRVTGDAVYLIVPRLSKGERGPIPFVRHRVIDTAETDSRGDTQPSRTLWTSAPHPGDTVIVAVVEGSIDELVVLGVQS